MRLRWGESWDDRLARRAKWHRHFAWFPTFIKTGDTRWLEYIERRGRPVMTSGGVWWDWEYRASSSSDAPRCKHDWYQGALGHWYCRNCMAHQNEPPSQAKGRG